ncbi:MAG: sugar phosphate isomerase/epimerase [Kiritimatiellaeota bacterium]|nr:sugar phosphate isomerase/epimerase [Kiritimatiellota bacterium]
MNIGVSNYSFARMKKTPVETVALAKELGFASIEFSGNMDRAAALAVREACERAGLPVTNYAIWADFLMASSVEAEAERLFAEVDIAAALGAKTMRHDASGGFTAPLGAYNCFDQALPVLAKGCRMVTEYAAAKGVVTTVENHGRFCQDSARVASLVGAVNHPNFGALVDIGNFVCVDEDPVVACGNLAGMAKHVHAKDFHLKAGFLDNPGEGWFMTRGGNFARGSIIGHGNVPVRQCLANLKRAGYDGTVSIEFEGMEENMTALRVGRANLEALLG